MVPTDIINYFTMQKNIVIEISRHFYFNKADHNGADIDSIKNI